jgi:hypothetical protein
MAYDARSRVHPDSIAFGLVARFGFDPVLVGLLVALVLPGLFWFAGYAEARSNRNFYLFAHSERSYLVLRIFQDKLISAPFDETNGTYSATFLIISPMNVTLRAVQLKQPPRIVTTFR